MLFRLGSRQIAYCRR